MCKILYTFLFIIFSYSLYSQEFVQFFYSDSTVSSEGYMKDGLPEGYWKNYYPNGTLKSVGKRTNFELDSIWNFYTEDGILEKSISYLHGKRNGYTIEYYTDRDTFLLKSKSLYVDNLKQRYSYNFSIEGYVEKIIPYIDNIKHGRGYELNKDSVKIALLFYNNNILQERLTINRLDSEGEKVGTWMDFYPNGAIRTESNYASGVLQGIFKMYDQHERLLRVGSYSNDSLVYSSSQLADFEEPIEVISYYSNSQIKSRGQFKDVIPVGVHRFYNTNGTIDSSYIYDRYGTLQAIGILLENGIKQGTWKYFYPNGVISSQGNYLNNLKSGDWVFYYEDSIIKQTGTFFQGLESGLWKWFYRNGNIKKREEYSGGKRNGLSEQFNIEGYKIVHGLYIDNKKNGFWYYETGDLIIKGRYIYDEKEGEWNHLYISNGKVRFSGSYFNTQAHGRHQYFYENGVLEREEFYRNGKPIRRWSYYDNKATLLYTVYYRNGEEHRIVVGERRRR